MGDTSIEWTQKSWNPVRGCSVVGPECTNCYAMGVGARFSKPGQPYDGLAKFSTKRRLPQWTGKVRMVHEHLEDPLHWRKPQKIFVNSMSDLFHEELTNEQIAAIFGVMAACPQHTFQVLTKRAARMEEWFTWAAKRGEHGLRLFPDDDLDWRIRQLVHVEARRAGANLSADRRQNHGGPWPLPNVWLGVSVGVRDGLYRINYLRHTPAAVRFIRFEPLLEDLGEVDLTGIDWAIIGGESGSRARPMDPDWARGLVRAAQRDGAAPFVKQLGSKVFAPWKLKWDERLDGSFDLFSTDRVGVKGTNFATVWPNGVWHTWDAHGVGGQNSKESSVDAAKNEALAALVRQHMNPIKGWSRHKHMLVSKKGGVMKEWPDDLQVREFPRVKASEHT